MAKTFQQYKTSDRRNIDNLTNFVDNISIEEKPASQEPEQVFVCSGDGCFLNNDDVIKVKHNGSIKLMFPNDYGNNSDDEVDVIGIPFDTRTSNMETE